MSVRVERFMVGSGWWEGSARSERRRGPRYQPRRSDVCLDWSEHGVVRRAEGRIVDVGSGGIRVEAEEAPAAGQDVWLEESAVLPAGGRKARVAESRWSVSKLKFIVRLVFAEELPINPDAVVPQEEGEEAPAEPLGAVGAGLTA